jgi:hypothetical protein
MAVLLANLILLKLGAGALVAGGVGWLLHIR